MKAFTFNGYQDSESIFDEMCVEEEGQNFHITRVIALDHHWDDARELVVDEYLNLRPCDGSCGKSILTPDEESRIQKLIAENHYEEYQQFLSFEED
jgi:hypothetical protein